MNATLRTALAAATLAAVLPVGIATAGGGSHGHGPNKPKKAKCHKGKGYEAQGILAAGSTLAQVSGADTARRSDDRFSGTLVVEVAKGNRRGRRDIGLSSYAVTSVKVNGAVRGAESALPALGARVLLVGKQTQADCGPTPTPTSTPVPTPTATPEPEATLVRHDDRPQPPKKSGPETTPTDDAPSTTPTADYPSDDAPAAGDVLTAAPTPVTDVQIKLVRFAAAR